MGGKPPRIVTGTALWGRNTGGAAAAATMYAGGALDAVGPQFYEQGTLSHGEMISNVADRITNIWLPAVGCDKGAIVLGFELSPSDDTTGDTMAPATAVECIQANPRPARGVRLEHVGRGGGWQPVHEPGGAGHRCLRRQPWHYFHD